MNATATTTATATMSSVANSTWEPLRTWNDWDPFRIDALGLVTLLGTPEVDNHVGKLVKNRFLEFLPLLGAYVLASDAFTEKQPSYQLYNINKELCTPDMAGWFSRWLITQDFRTASSYVKWRIESVPYTTRGNTFMAFIIGFVLNGGFLMLTVLMGDWWGFSNAMSMAISTAARWYLVDRNRTWIDQAVMRAIQKNVNDALDPKYKGKVDKAIVDLEKIKLHGYDKVIIVLPDARAVALSMPACLIKECFVLNPKPPNSKDETKRAKTFPPKGPNQKQVKTPPQLRYYQLVRAFAWLAFGAHVITIGMSTLVSQLVTVFIIVGPTVLMTYGIGADHNRVGSRLYANITDFPHENENEERRIDLYAFLNLDEAQRKSLEQWNLAPFATKESWWANYRRKKVLYNEPKPLIDMETNEDRQAELQTRKIRAAANQTAQQIPDPSTAQARHTSIDTA